MPLDSLEVTALTDVGSVRQFNEDSVAVDAARGILALADGMGGHRAGEVASRMAIEVLMTGLAAAADRFRPNSRQRTPALAVTECIKRANRTIFEAGRLDPRYRGMGTTVALAVFYDDEVTLAHVGDSRVYRLRGGRLALLTRDDSLLRDQVDLGVISAADARQSHNRSLVTRALGVAPTVNPHVLQEPAAAGDVYLVCSDGLNDLVEDDDIELILNALEVNLPLAAAHLVQAAKDNGGLDNVSVLVARVGAPFPAAQGGWLAGLWERLRAAVRG
jgi:PPM family protein phosphatase